MERKQSKSKGGGSERERERDCTEKDTEKIINQNIYYAYINDVKSKVT